MPNNPQTNPNPQNPDQQNKESIEITNDSLKISVEK
jgi:hypothetical protein